MTVGLLGRKTVPFPREVVSPPGAHTSPPSFHRRREGKQPLSAEVRDVTGIPNTASGDDFARVIQLLDLCPERPEERGHIRAINAYFRFLNFVRSSVARIIPPLLPWTEMERGQCTYSAAVTLDRRIAFSRDMLAQQMDS